MCWQEDRSAPSADTTNSSQFEADVDVCCQSEVRGQHREVRGQTGALDRSEHISWGKNEPEVHEKKIENI